MTIQPHHLHTHGPEPLYTPVKADDVRPKIDVRKFDLDDCIEEMRETYNDVINKSTVEKTKDKT